MIRRRRLLVLLGAVALLLGLSACGLPDDGSPRVIADDALPPELTDRPDATIPIPPEQAEIRQIYLVSSDGDTSRLVAVDREMRRIDNIEAKVTATLNSLIKRGKADQPEDAGEFTTWLPAGLKVNGVTIQENTVTIDLNGDLANVDNPGQSLAYAQLVYTATQFPDLRNVRFTNNGETASALNGAGGSAPAVTRDSYLNFAPLPD